MGLAGDAVRDAPALPGGYFKWSFSKVLSHWGAWGMVMGKVGFWALMA